LGSGACEQAGLAAGCSGLLGCLTHSCSPECETPGRMGARGEAGDEEQEAENKSEEGGRGELWHEAGSCLWLW